MPSGTAKRTVSRRIIIQDILWPVVFIVVGLGWKFPLLGFVVPAVMVMGMAGGVFYGRYVCGNLCPRGSFFDRILMRVSLKRNIPTFLRNMVFRGVLLTGLMGLMVWRVLQNPTSLAHWGRVFWLMCAVTTGIGVVMGILIHPRAWCALCPMGTLQNMLGGRKRQLLIDSERCVECRACESVCPFDLKLVSSKPGGVLTNRDCLKCSECVAVCPKSALSWPDVKTS